MVRHLPPPPARSTAASKFTLRLACKESWPAMSGERDPFPLSSSPSISFPLASGPGAAGTAVFRLQPLQKRSVFCFLADSAVRGKAGGLSSWPKRVCHGHALNGTHTDVMSQQRGVVGALLEPSLFSTKWVGSALSTSPHKGDASQY